VSQLKSFFPKSAGCHAVALIELHNCFCGQNNGKEIFIRENCVDKSQIKFFFLKQWKGNIYSRKLCRRISNQVFRDLQYTLLIQPIRPREEVCPKTGYFEFSVTSSTSPFYLWKQTSRAIFFLLQSPLPPAHMNPAKIFNGWPLRDAPLKLVQLWYKTIPPDHDGRWSGGNEKLN